MVGSLLSVLLLGTVPVWGVGNPGIPLARDLGIAAPVTSALADTIPESLQGRLSASGVIIIDLDSAQTVYAQQPLQPRPMASLTKLMTALIIAEHHDLGERVIISQSVVGTDGSVVGLKPGDDFSVGDLLTALLVDSANDAAVALAVYHSGSTDAFIEEMNDRAASLGLDDTVYMTANGLDAPGQYSTPRDLGILSAFVLRSPVLAARMSLSSSSIESRSGTILSFVHTHQLLRQQMADAPASGDSVIRAGKTGTTDGAGECLMSVFEKGGHRYAAVLLHSRDRYGDMRRILSAFDR